MFGEASQLDLTFPLASVQDLVKKMERANLGETLRRDPYYHDKSILMKFPRVPRQALSQPIFQQIHRPKPNQSNADNRQDDRKYFRS